MTITFTCSACGKQFHVSDELAGKRGRCKQCGAITRIPAEVPDPHDLVPVETEWIVPCDDCGKEYRPSDDLIGKRVRCECGAILVLQENPDRDIRLAPLADTIPPVAPSNVGQAPPAYSGYAGQVPPLHTQLSQSAAGGVRTPSAAAHSRREREDELLAPYEVDDAWRSEHVEGAEDTSEFAFEQSAINYGVLGGAALVVIGAAWLIIGLAFGYFFFYTPVLIVLGMISIVRGLV